MLFPPTPLQTPAKTPMPQTPMHGAVDYNFTTGPPDFASLNDIDIKAGRPSPYMQPPSPWMNQSPLGVDVNVAYDEGGDDLNGGASHQPLTQDFFMTSSGKRKWDDYTSLAAGAYLPQQDGSGDITIEFFLPKVNEGQNSGGKGREISVTGANSSEEANTAPVFPQQDGIHDEYDNMFHYGGVSTEDYNAVNTPADHVELQAATPTIGIPTPTKTEVLDDDEPPLNEDDDDDEDLDEFEREEEPQTQHLILAQFDKVSRTKARWKCTLKDGILHLNNRDILFNKATGEFDF
ncbi:uncharacterized protein A4U43_C07F870 [Asparagus officinalis]|uniref:Uncharacterized protein n=2 Tax=Asparagus officinalis TaxID=4686 RepID=A0A5P1EBI8_ASPOF|nr:uncharacterized protein A4U43_C07F870 [Asparagus officinalis]